MNYSILLFDLDPQSNLSLALGLETEDASINSANILIEYARVISAIRKTEIKNLDLIPSSLRIENAEQFLPMRTHYLTTLREALEADPLSYDFILLDCPPALGAITLNALSAANLLIIPTQAEYFSAYALRNMMGTIRRVRQEVNPALAYRIIVTLLDRRNRTHRNIFEQLQATFGLAAPMLAGTLITIASFVPIGFARSSAGEYTFSIFAVVAIALITSSLVAVIFAPVIGLAILKAPRAGADEKPSRLMTGYAKFLSLAMRAKWLTIAVTVVAFAAAVYGAGFIPRQFFPSSDRPALLVDLTLRQNASIFAAETVAKRLDAALAKDEDVKSWSTYVGRGAIRFYLPLNVQLQNEFFAQAVVVAKDYEARRRLHHLHRHGIRAA